MKPKLTFTKKLASDLNDHDVFITEYDGNMKVFIMTIELCEQLMPIVEDIHGVQYPFNRFGHDWIAQIVWVLDIEKIENFSNNMLSVWGQRYIFKQLLNQTQTMSVVNLKKEDR